MTIISSGTSVAAAMRKALSASIAIARGRNTRGASRGVQRAWKAGRPVLLAMLVLAAGCASETLSPLAPVSKGAAKTVAALPDMPLSVVDAPISYALEPALEALERAVPRKFGDIEKRLAVATNTRQQIAFAATRTPFDVSFDGRRLTLATVVSYSGRGWYKPVIGPTISAGCGVDTLQPRLRLVLHTDVGIARDWNLQTRTRLATIEPATATPRDLCRVSAFSIDVTDKVVKSIGPLLEGKLSEVDRRIAQFNLRKRLEGWYNLLNKGIRVTDSLWLVLSPQGLRLGSLTLQDTALVANVRLFAKPFMVSGPKPPLIVSTLPPYSKAAVAVGDSAHLRLEGLLNYDDASAKLASKMVGRTFRRFNQSVTIERVKLYSLGDGRVVLMVGLKGGVKGDAYLVGTPVLDTMARLITVPDLDFDVATADDLVRGLAWLKKGDMVATLRKRAVLPLEDILDETRGKVEKALNRELTRGVHLTGRVTTGRLVDVVAMPRWFIVRAEATGSLALHIDREIPAPKKARAAD